MSVLNKHKVVQSETLLSKSLQLKQVVRSVNISLKDIAGIDTEHVELFELPNSKLCVIDKFYVSVYTHTPNTLIRIGKLMPVMVSKNYLIDPSVTIPEFAEYKRIGINYDTNQSELGAFSNIVTFVYPYTRIISLDPTQQSFVTFNQAWSDINGDFLSDSYIFSLVNYDIWTEAETPLNVVVDENGFTSDSTFMQLTLITHERPDHKVYVPPVVS